jgi:hypothetical protein
MEKLGQTASIKTVHLIYGMYHIFTSEKLLPEKWQDYVLQSVGRKNATKEILLSSFI